LSTEGARAIIVAELTAARVMRNFATPLVADLTVRRKSHSRPPAGTLPAMASQTILVAEDDRAIRELLTHHLEREGFAVVGASDGHAALRRARAAADLLVLDIGLPGVDGYDVVRTLRREERGIPIVVLTARADEIDRVLAFELGVDDYICKRFCSESKKVVRDPSVVATRPPTIRERAFAAARCSVGAASGQS
jgi:CheY-like chemotaxis protein